MRLADGAEVFAITVLDDALIANASLEEADESGLLGDGVRVVATDGLNVNGPVASCNDFPDADIRGILGGKDMEVVKTDGELGDGFLADFIVVAAYPVDVIVGVGLQYSESRQVSGRDRQTLRVTAPRNIFEHSPGFPDLGLFVDGHPTSSERLLFGPLSRGLHDPRDRGAVRASEDLPVFVGEDPYEAVRHEITAVVAVWH